MAGSNVGAVWITPPSSLVAAYAKYGEKVLVAVKAVTDFIKQKMQDEARRNAPWTDRTSNARSGLFAVVDDAAKDIVTLYLAHTMSYGVFLELSNGGKYSIIMKTIQANLPVIEKMLKEIFA